MVVLPMQQTFPAVPVVATVPAVCEVPLHAGLAKKLVAPGFCWGSTKLKSAACQKILLWGRRSCRWSSSGGCKMLFCSPFLAQHLFVQMNWGSLWVPVNSPFMNSCSSFKQEWMRVKNIRMLNKLPLAFNIQNVLQLVQNRHLLSPSDFSLNPACHWHIFKVKQWAVSHVT